jgi:hypothetical protein
MLHDQLNWRSSFSLPEDLELRPPPAWHVAWAAAGVRLAAIAAEVALWLFVLACWWWVGWR